MKCRIVVIVLMCLPWIANAKHVVEVGVHGGLTGWSAQTVYVRPQIGFQGGARLLYAYHSPYVLSPYDTPRVSLRNCRCDRE